MHPCIELSSITNIPKEGDIKGVCRITGKESTGLPFKKWVRKTFMDHDALYDGSIISNEALFCFSESSEILQKKVGKDKPQRFRTYSHVITQNGEWYALTKADKKFIYELISLGETKIVCLTDTGQKHLFFKHKPGFWQLDEFFIEPNIPQLKQLHAIMQTLQGMGFGQEQIKSGNYYQSKILEVGISTWKALEDQLKPFRGTLFFDFTAWLMYKLD